MILKTVEKYIANNKLIDKGDKLIIGVSGGVDSVALLDILVSLGYVCIVGHCNFHLRDEDSNRDALFVKELCLRYDVPFYSIDFDTTSYARRHSISVEMAARELRYEWFEKLRIETKAECIAVAHHQDDSVETVLLNLLRGTGIAGLTGISCRNKYLIRPLLCISRTEIIDYLKNKQLNFVEDYTNYEDQYTRNKIRLNILPLMQSVNPSVKKAILQTSANLSEVEKIYNEYVKYKKKEILIDNKVNISKLLNCASSEAILFEILSDFQFNRDTVKIVHNCLLGQSGKIFFSDTHEVLKDRDFLMIRERYKQTDLQEYLIETAPTLLSSPLRIDIRIIAKSELIIDKSKEVIYLDNDKIQFPLKLRHWQKGDWFIPFGMSGKKKVSDYFSDNKYSLFEKKNAWLLFSGSDLVWIVGKRSDNRFRVTDRTKSVLQIKLF